MEISDHDYNNLKINNKTSESLTTEFIPYRPNKLEPNSDIDMDLKGRIGALIVGVLLALFLIGIVVAEMSSWEISRNMWKYLGYTVIAFGILGFMFREKIFDIVMKLIKWLPF